MEPRQTSLLRLPTLSKLPGSWLPTLLVTHQALYICLGVVFATPTRRTYPHSVVDLHFIRQRLRRSPFPTPKRPPGGVRDHGVLTGAQPWAQTSTVATRVVIIGGRHGFHVEIKILRAF